MLKPILAKFFGKTNTLESLEIETTVYLENGEIRTERRPIQEL